MTPEAFALLVASCHIAMPPGITVDRLSTIAEVESGRNIRAVSPPNRDGSRDYGILQVNQQWLPRFRLTPAQIMEPCTNLRVGVAILADADRRAYCIWNTGKPVCRNGYPERVQAVAARMTLTTSVSAAPAPPSPASPRHISTTAFGRRQPGRTVTYGKR